MHDKTHKDRKREIQKGCNGERSKEKAEHRKREGTGDCTWAGNGNVERTTEQNAIGNKQENAKLNAHLHCYKTIFKNSFKRNNGLQNGCITRKKYAKNLTGIRCSCLPSMQRRL